MFVRLALLATAVAAQQRRAVAPHPLSQIPPAHPDVEVSSILPKYPDNVVPMGEPFTVVVSFVNKGEVPINISGIIGSLNDARTFAYLENYTAIAVGDIVDAGSEIGLEYTVLPRVPSAMDAQLAITVFYEDMQQYYANTFFNETITFTPGASASLLDVRPYLPYALAASCVAVALYILSIPVLEKSRSAAAAAAAAARRGGADGVVGSVLAAASDKKKAKRA